MLRTRRSPLARHAATVLAVLLPATVAAQRPFTDADIMRVATVGGLHLSPDGTRAVYTVTAWEHPNARGDTALGDRHERRSHVWLVPTSGGAPRQLTTGERGESNPRWSPDGRTIAFLAARGTGTGDDAPRPQLWLLPADGGEATVLTTSRSGVSAYAWSPDGRHIAYLATDTVSREQEARTRRRDDATVYEGESRLVRLWVIDVTTREARQLTRDAFSVRGTPSWSPDGTRLAFDASPTPLIRDERRDAYVVDAATGTLTAVTSTTDVRSTPQFAPDGRTLAFTRLPHEWKPNADGIMPRTLGNARLVTYDLTRRTLTDHAQRTFDVDVGQPEWSADGRTIRFIAGDRVYRSVYTYDLASRSYAQRTRERLVNDLAASRDDARIAMLIESPEHPAEVFVTDGLDATPRRLTTTNPWLAEVALGRSEVITWKSRDGNTVEGVVLYPVNYTPGRAVPLVVSAHGGPTSAHVNGFKGGTGPSQTWASRGWAVLYPNPRGSTGYGASFMRANMGDWGGGDYRDLMAGVDELVRRGVADPDRLAFEGWSYGGYLTSWVVSQTGRFKAAMMGAGLPSLLSMANTTDIPGYIATFFNGYPQYDGSLVNKNIRFYLERSAISYSDRITTPLLILHGANDERVPIGQPMEFYRALKDRGKTVELVFYPREGHGLTEYYHQLDRMKREYEWMARHTLGTRVLQ
jgi:dipeptidyl aminopeptidase/acylaminoacyl peptidase